MKTRDFIYTGPYPWQYVDPDAVLDWSVDWSRWLAKVGSTIETVTWSVDGYTKGVEANTETKATVLLGPGEAGKTYTVTCAIVTVDGHAEDQSFQLKMQPN